MSVSLVKIGPSTRVWTVGHNPSGYMPDPDSVLVAVTVAEARSYLASELDRLADALADSQGEDDDTEASDEYGYASAMVGIVERDPEGDVTWGIVHYGGYSVTVGWETYWVNESTLGDVYGTGEDTDDDDDYLETVARLLEVA